MSGDMNTSVGNCLLMCSLVFEYIKEIKVKARLFNNGDDCVLFMERRDLEKFSFKLHSWFTNYGFDLTIEDPVYCFERVNFCQMNPVNDGDKYVMMRNPFVAMRKDGVSLKPIDSEKLYKRWVRTVGEGGMSLTGGLPVSQCYYASMIKCSSNARPLTKDEMFRDSGLYRWSRGMTRRFRAPSTLSRVSFYLAFGTTPEEQQALEAVYQHSIWSYRLENFGRLVHLPRWA
uniref:RNA-directed RNA polymerase n=1 Tax=Riboviria sp. TaxID=2585031 RepID=A0A514CZB9_9VIRU|nr:MAG: RNA-dependent RNA polymerase [Riboviria sp.]